MMVRPLVSVVMPAHNEQAALARVVAEVASALAIWPHEIVIVDDGSVDGTWDEICRLAAIRPSVRGIRLTRNFGHQAALAAGLRAAAGAAIVTMDSDGQHPPDLLPALVSAWEQGHRVVQTIRRPSTREGRWKALTSRWFYSFWSALSGVRIVRGAADFRLLDRRVLDALLQMGGSLTFLRGLVHWLGFETHYIPFDVLPRQGGAPAYTWRRMLALSVDGLTAFSVVPLRFAMALGVTVSAVSFAYLCYVVLVWLFSSHAVAGWASTAGLMAMLGGIQLFTIGVLGEYVGRIFLRTTDRPPFVVADVTGSADVEAPAIEALASARRRVTELQAVSASLDPRR